MEQAAAGSRARHRADDIIAWKTIGATALSNDGQWFGYRLAPGEGDAQVIVRRTPARELKFDIGDPTRSRAKAAGAAGRRRRRHDGGAFSDDAKWVAFTTYPARAEAQRLRRQRRR